MELRDRINYNKKLLERYNDENQNTHEEVLMLNFFF